MLARVMIPKLVWLVITNARLMERDEPVDAEVDGLWADEIATAEVVRKRFSSHIAIAGVDGKSRKIPIMGRNARELEQALKQMLAEPNLQAQRELEESAATDPGDPPLNSYGNFQLWPNRLVYEHKTYVLDAQTHAEAHVDQQVGSVFEGYVESAPVVTLVVAHPAYSFAFRANPNDSSEVQALAARINAVAAATQPANAPSVTDDEGQ